MFSFGLNFGWGNKGSGGWAPARLNLLQWLSSVLGTEAIDQTSNELDANYVKSHCVALDGLVDYCRFSGYRPDIGSSDFEIEFTTIIPAVTRVSVERPIAHYLASANERGFMVSFDTDGAVRFSTSSDGVSVSNYDTVSAVLVADTPQTFVISKSGTVATLTINGVPVSWTGSAAASIHHSSEDFLVGNRGSLDTTDFLEGKVLGVKLTISGVVDMYSPFAEGSGATSYDTSGNGNHGTWSGTLATIRAGETDAYHANLIDGHSKVLSFNGTDVKAAFGNILEFQYDDAFEISFYGSLNDVAGVIASNYKHVSPAYAGWNVSISADSTLQFLLRLTASVSMDAVFVSAPPTFGIMSYFQISYDGSGDASGVVIKQDGVTLTPTIVYDSATTGTIVYDQTVPFKIGDRNVANTLPFNGTLSRFTVTGDHSLDVDFSKSYGTHAHEASGNHGTVSNPEWQYLPALADGTDDVAGLGLTNPGGSVHNNCETLIQQKELPPATIVISDTGTAADATYTQVSEYNGKGEWSSVGGVPNEDGIGIWWTGSNWRMRVGTGLLWLNTNDTLYPDTTGWGLSETGDPEPTVTYTYDNEFWYPDGLTAAKKTFEDLITHLDLWDFVIAVGTSPIISDIITFDQDTEFTPSEYKNLINWLTVQGEGGEHMVPHEVLNGGIGPGEMWYTGDSEHILLVEHVDTDSIVYKADASTVTFDGDIPEWAAYGGDFEDCVKADIGNTCTEIGYDAFYYCIDLTTVTLPTSLITLGTSVFNRCYSLDGIIIPNSVTTIGEEAFKSCEALTSIIIPNMVTSLDDYVFKGCTALTSIIIGGSVTTIGGYTFENCTALASVDIPNSVTAISNWAFKLCNSLVSISIGTGLTSIYYGSLYGCTSLASITVDANNPNYSSLDNVLFNKDQTSLLKYSGGLSATSYTVPDSVTTITRQSFSQCTSLTSIVLVDGVTTIEYDAFYGSSNITSLDIPTSVTALGDYLFSGCTSLTSMNCYVSRDVMDENSSLFGSSVATLHVRATDESYTAGADTIGSKAVTIVKDL